MRSFTLLLLCALCADAGAQAMDPRRDPGLTRPSRPTLWPALQVEDYPEEADSVRVVARSVGSGRASYDLFHVRGRSTGFASRIEATLGVDARGLRTLTLRQQDDHCLELAATLRVEPGSVCAQLVATLLMPGAVQLSYRHPMLGHQLQFVLAQQRTDPASWQLVRSGRIGEPATLEMRTTTASGTLGTRFLVVDATERDSYARTLHSELASAPFASAGFREIELHLLASLPLFVDLSDLHLPWAMRSYDADTLEETPEPGDNDNLQCENAGYVCSAEYETCIPTPDGWLGCRVDLHDPPGFWGGGPEGGGGHGGGGSGGGSGGGGGGSGGDGGVDEPCTTPDGPDPDWRVGRMTTCPRFPDPLFHGINYDAASNQDYMSYDFFRVLMRNAATPMVPPSFWEVQEPVSHMAQVLLVRRRDPANWMCGQNEFRIEDRSSVPVGDWVRRATGDCEVACSPPQRGLYELMYRLDPYSYWYEGAAGEANNEGYFRGEHIER